MFSIILNYNGVEMNCGRTTLEICERAEVPVEKFIGQADRGDIELDRLTLAIAKVVPLVCGPAAQENANDARSVRMCLEYLIYQHKDIWFNMLPEPNIKAVVFSIKTSADIVKYVTTEDLRRNWRKLDADFSVAVETNDRTIPVDQPLVALKKMPKKPGSDTFQITIDINADSTTFGGVTAKALRATDSLFERTLRKRISEEALANTQIPPMDIQHLVMTETMMRSFHLFMAMDTLENLDISGASKEERVKIVSMMAIMSRLILPEYRRLTKAEQKRIHEITVSWVFEKPGLHVYTCWQEETMDIFAHPFSIILLFTMEDGKIYDRILFNFPSPALEKMMKQLEQAETVE